jgi:HSP20 family molecular chaperone IbpA
MFRKPDSTDWMWAHAIDLIEQAGHMHRQFFRLSSAQAQTIWEPPVDMFEDDLEVVIVVAMPGVVAEHIEVTSAPGELVVRAERPLPFTAGRRAVRQLEIPYGRFERRIPLPDGRFEAVSHELSHGCLILRLRKTD